MAGREDAAGLVKEDGIDGVTCLACVAGGREAGGLGNAEEALSFDVAAQDDGAGAGGDVGGEGAGKGGLAGAGKAADGDQAGGRGER